ncbi:MAG: tetratricopeptide repeat protein [Planctomycetia bacterium]
MRGATMRDEQRSVPIDELDELEGNALAEKTLEIIDRLRPHTNTILLILGGLLVALAAWVVVSSQAATTKSQAWDAFLAGLSGGDPQAFDEVVRRYPGTPAAEWSRLVMADMALIDGTELLFVNKDQAPPRLRAAAELYASILASRPAAMLAERATFGLAKARESLGQLEEARRGYAAVAAEHPDGALAGLARTHAAALDRESTRQWYDWFAAQTIAPPAQKPADDEKAAAGEKPAEPPAKPQE